MKKFILAALAASVLAAPVLAAPNDRRDDRGHRTVVVQKHNKVVIRQVRRGPAQQARAWRKGDRFESRYARNYRVIQTPRSYKLREAPRGYRWVQSGSDAVLIGVTSGIVASVIANAVR